MKKKTTMPNLSYYGTSRYMCDVLEEMRTCYKTYNFSPVMSLIEEAQILASHMEGGLSGIKGLKDLENDIHKLKVARRKLKAEVETLIRKRDKHESNKNS